MSCPWIWGLPAASRATGWGATILQGVLSVCFALPCLRFNWPFRASFGRVRSPFGVRPRRRGFAALLLCLAVAPTGVAQQQQVMFTIWDSSGKKIHEVFRDGGSDQSAADVSAFREIPSILSAPPPKYPKRLADLGMKGWVRVKFTITEEGEVANPEILEMHPRKYFARAALRTIKKYRFAPPTLDGVPTPLPDVTVRMTFDPEGN